MGKERSVLVVAVALILVGLHPIEGFASRRVIFSSKSSRTTSLFRAISSEEVNERLSKQLEKLRVKDKASIAPSTSDLKVVFEDDDVIVVDKPSGVLTVAADPQIPSLAKTVHEHCQGSLLSEDRMVVHRLGMDTSGLIVFAKTIDAVRGMNALFRTRKITRQYEALVCGHLEKDTGLVTLPLMRDYEHPPFMRVSTEEHQRVLLDLDPAVVGKKMVEAPKASLTHYQVIQREDLDGLPVTRVILTSISGRTHQLNVHMAALGHPIVQDAVYGYGGDAAAFGGVPPPPAVDESALKELAQKTSSMNMCVHSKLLRFRHPITKEQVESESKAPF